jgi:signal transduction histidine kinase
VIWINLGCVAVWIIIQIAAGLGFHNARPLGVAGAGLGMAICWSAALRQISTGRMARGVATYTISGLLLLLAMGMFVPELSLLFTLATFIFLAFGLSYMSGTASLRIVALTLVVALILLVTSVALKWTSGVPVGTFRWINLIGMLMALSIDATMFIMLRRTLEARADRLVAAEREAVQLQQRIAQQQRLESVGLLAGGIAHDFNNLLGVIMGYAAFVSAGAADAATVRADVEKIQAAAERAARLTKQLLIFARRETVESDLLDMNVIVTEVHDLLSRTIGEHIEFRVELLENLPAVWADRGQLEQVLLNLAVNARDAMPDGGALTVATRVADFREGDAGLHSDVSSGRYVELAVGDTGTGMSAEVAQRIFEPFFTTKPRGQGTGLGLATVYGIVTGADGGMTVESEEGRGTTFHVYLPAREPATSLDAIVAAPRTDGQGETILVVEDELDVLELTSRILRQGGYEVLEACTFERALHLAASTDFQLLLTDSIMPHMSGRVLAARVAELRPGTAVLYMSGYSEGVLNPERALPDGVALIQKPFTARTLLEYVRNALGTGPGAAGAAA